MNKLLLASFIAIVPAIASAQVLVSGYNFGQFIGVNDAAIDPTAFTDEGRIFSNWAHNTPPPIDSQGQLGLYSPAYNNGTGAVYWDGTAGSSNLVGAGNVVAFDNPSFSQNAFTITGTNMALLGDWSGANMALAVGGAYSLGFVQNMNGFLDFAGPNLTFAAQAAASPITISWVFGGATVATTNVGTAWAAYTVDLPANFYGSISELTASFSGAGRIDNVQFNAAIPEPSTYAALLGLLTAGFAMVRRRFAAAA